MNLIEGIQEQCDRVRRILPYYEALGPVGAFGAAMLKAAIKQGEAAIASGDVMQCLEAYKTLEGCKE